MNEMSQMWQYTCYGEAGNPSVLGTDCSQEEVRANFVENQHGHVSCW
jgi:hypothetical protein